MAHIHKSATAKGTRHDVRWRLPNGGFRQKGFYNAKQAKDFLATVTLAPMDTSAGKITFAEVAHGLLDSPPRPLKPKTLEGYRARLKNYITPEFGHRKIGSITTREIAQWQQELQRNMGLSDSTKRGILVLMSKVMRHAHRTGLIQSNPMFAIQMPPMPLAGEARFLSPAEVETLALTIETQTWATPFGDLVRFAAWTGLRAGELVGLQVGDVDLKRGVVRVKRTVRKVSGGWEATTPKSQRSTREVPLAPNVAGVLADYLAAHPRKGEPTAPLFPGKVFCSSRQGEIDWYKPHNHQVFMRRYFQPTVKSLGLEPLRFHDLRHTFASLCAEGRRPDGQGQPMDGARLDHDHRHRLCPPVRGPHR